jgi:hypothetical protein
LILSWLSCNNTLSPHQELEDVSRVDYPGIRIKAEQEQDAPECSLHPAGSGGGKFGIIGGAPGGYRPGKPCIRNGAFGGKDDGAIGGPLSVVSMQISVGAQD